MSTYKKYGHPREKPPTTYGIRLASGAVVGGGHRVYHEKAVGNVCVTKKISDEIKKKIKEKTDVPFKVGRTNAAVVVKPAPRPKARPSPFDPPPVKTPPVKTAPVKTQPVETVPVKPVPNYAALADVTPPPTPASATCVTLVSPFDYIEIVGETTIQQRIPVMLLVKGEEGALKEHVLSKRLVAPLLRKYGYNHLYIASESQQRKHMRSYYMLSDNKKSAGEWGFWESFVCLPKHIVRYTEFCEYIDRIYAQMMDLVIVQLNDAMTDDSISRADSIISNVARRNRQASYPILFIARHDLPPQHTLPRDHTLNYIIQS